MNSDSDKRLGFRPARDLRWGRQGAAACYNSASPSDRARREDGLQRLLLVVSIGIKLMRKEVCIYSVSLFISDLRQHKKTFLLLKKGFIFFPCLNIN